MSYSNISAAALRKGGIMAALAATSYGASVVFVSMAYRSGVLPGAAVFLRFIIASVVLVSFLALSGRQIILPRQNSIVIFLLGFVGYTTMGTTFYVSLSLLPAWLVGLFTALYPLVVNLGSWLFLKEPISRRQVWALVAVLAGGVFLFLQPFEDISWLGILLMCINVVAVSTYMLVGQRWTKGIPPMTSATWTVSGAALGTLIYALSVNELSLDFAPIGWFWVFCFAVISTAFATMTLWWGISLIGAARASIVISFEPLAAVLMAVLFLGESISAMQMVGGAFIMVGVFVIQFRQR